MRIGFGAFPLSVAVIVFACLLSTRRILMGLSVLATVVGVTTAVRLAGAIVDGAAPETLMVVGAKNSPSLSSGAFIRSRARSVPATRRSNGSRRPARTQHGTERVVEPGQDQEGC